jgi:prepilin-type N-terminal cleavage/methylation domain-containing protein
MIWILADDRGFTLVEVLVALLLAATVAAGVAGLVAIAIESTNGAAQQTRAAVLASQKVEQLRAALAAGDAIGSSAETVDASGRALADPLSGPPAYTRQWAVSSRAVGTSAYFRIRVGVRAVARGGIPRMDGGLPRDTREVSMTTTVRMAR